MDVRWQAVLVLGAAALTAVIGWALVVPLAKTRQVLRPLAHVDRLTSMPEYARLARIRFWAMLAALLLLLTMFTTAVLATARPVGFSSATRNFEAAHPQDIMVCVGQPVTDPTTAGYLNYYAQRVRTFGSQRIGLTSPTLRVMPLTRDYDHAATQFARYAALTGLQHQLDTTKKLPGPQADELRSGINDFSRDVTYVDYTRSVHDILALCMTGFPRFEDKSTRRRSLIYLGYSDFRGSNNTRPSLFSDQQIKDMAAAAGVQINIVNRADVVKSPQESNAALAAIAAASGGRYSVYNPAGTAADNPSGTDATLAELLDAITANPPDVVLPSGAVITRRSWEYPNVALQCSLLVTAVLFAAAGVLRR